MVNDTLKMYRSHSHGYRPNDERMKDIQRFLIQQKSKKPPETEQNPIECEEDTSKSTTDSNPNSSRFRGSESVFAALQVLRDTVSAMDVERSHHSADFEGMNAMKSEIAKYKLQIEELMELNERLTLKMKESAEREQNAMEIAETAKKKQSQHEQITRSKIESLQKQLDHKESENKCLHQRLEKETKQKQKEIQFLEHKIKEIADYKEENERLLIENHRIKDLCEVVRDKYQNLQRLMGSFV